MKTSFQRLAQSRLSRHARRTFLLTPEYSPRRHSRRRGSVTLIAALGIVVILGAGALAVDYSILLSDRNRLQRACDAAALAGASQLKLTDNDTTDTTNAKNVAVTVAGQNNVTVNSNDISFQDSNKQIRVPANTTRSLLFARLLGIMSKPVATSAVAGVNPAGNYTPNPTIYIAPIGITWETYNAYKNDQGTHDLDFIRQNKMTFGLDDFVLFDLSGPNGKSTAHMQDQLTGDEREDVTIGSFQTTLNAAEAAQSTKLDRGFDILFDRADGPPWNDPGSDGYSNGQQTAYQQIYNGTLNRTNPRVIHIIITPQTTVSSNGTYNTEVQGFVPVYLESIDADKHGGTTITVRFLPPTNASDGGFEPNPGGIMGGVRVISLTG
jgi:Flp pilus assembly protein TadG